jgi:hypothetical protein
MKDEKLTKLEWIAISIMLFWIVLYASFGAFLIWCAVHFIRKYW